MSIDKNKIKAGDEVRATFTSHDATWTSSLTVVKSTPDGLKVGGFFLGGLEVTEHKPNFKELEDAVEAAEKALEAARRELDNAKKDAESEFRFKVGDQVILASGYVTTIEACGDKDYPNAYRVSGGLHYNISQIDRWNS